MERVEVGSHRPAAPNQRRRGRLGDLTVAKTEGGEVGSGLPTDGQGKLKEKKTLVHQRGDGKRYTPAPNSLIVHHQASSTIKPDKRLASSALLPAATSV